MSEDTTQDTSVSEPTTEEVVDTSTNEEVRDTDVAADLEDDDTSFDDVDDDDTEGTDDSEYEMEDTEPAESEEESKEDVAEESKDEPAEEESKEESTPSEDVKKHNAEMAARRIAEKQAKEAEKQKQQQEYLEQAEDDKDLALRQLQVDAYNNKVERNRSKLDSGIEKAVASIDLFRTGTPEVKEELARRLEDYEAKHVQYDTNGEPISVTGDVYEYLQSEADSIRRILNAGARQQVKDGVKTKSRTDTLPSRAPKEKPVDPDMAAFDEEVAKWD